VKELEEHLRTALSMLTKRDVTITSLESRVTSALDETDGYRKRLAGLMQRAVIKHRQVAPKLPSKPRKLDRASTRPKVKRAARRAAPKRSHRR
jgi:hypothetical protein